MTLEWTNVNLNATITETTYDQYVNHDIPSYQSNIAITIIIGLFMLIGSCGSLFTIIVICQSKHFRKKANMFIVSLCFSDLISALVCSPLWLYRRTWGFHNWYWGDFACKFYWQSDFTTNYVTSLHILSLSALRCVAVRHPFLIKQISNKIILCYIFSLWVISLLAALPLVFLMAVDSERKAAVRGSCWPSCSIDSNHIEDYNTYATVVNSVMFFIPEILIIIFTSVVVYVLVTKRRWRKHIAPKLHKQKESRMNTVTNVAALQNNNNNLSFSAIKTSNCNTISQNYNTSLTLNCSNPSTINNLLTKNYTKVYNHEKKAFVQLGLIVFAYLLGYIPMTVYLIWTVEVDRASKGPYADYLFGVISYLCLRLSECMNPLMYNLGSSNIRNESKKVLKKYFNIKHIFKYN